MSLIDCRSGLSPSQIQNINFLTKSWCYIAYSDLANFSKKLAYWLAKV